MIKYRLICKDCKTSFDSWFPSSIEYERLQKKNFINCHICNSLRVEKTLMSPNVFTVKDDSNTSVKNQRYKETKKVMLNIKNLLKKILNTWGRIFLTKQDLFIIKIKKS